jgi:hypothetical protein
MPSSQLSTWCVLRPKGCWIREAEDCDDLASVAVIRIDQWLSSPALVSDQVRVACTPACRPVIFRNGPGLGAAMRILIRRPTNPGSDLGPSPATPQSIPGIVSPADGRACQRSRAPFAPAQEGSAAPLDSATAHPAIPAWHQQRSAGQGQESTLVKPTTCRVIYDPNATDLVSGHWIGSRTASGPGGGRLAPAV